MPPPDTGRPATHVEMWAARASQELAAAWHHAVPDAALGELTGLREVERDRRIVQLALRQSAFGARLRRPLREVALASAATGEIVPPSLAWAVSASHHDDMTVLALTEGPRAIGIDIEPLYEQGWDDVLDDVLTPRELHALAALPPPKRPAAYFTCWTLKEAVMKARGEGLSDRDPKSIEVTVPPAAARLVALDGVAAPADWSLATVLLDQHVCSLAAAGTWGLAIQERRWPIDLPPLIR